MRALIYHLPLGEMDGTSVVLRRVYGPDAASIRQISFRRGHFPLPSEFSVEQIKGNVDWPWRKGARFVHKNWRRLMVPSLLKRSRWVADTRDASTQKAIKSIHVVVYDEPNAELARYALEAAGLKNFTLHLMDLLLDEPIGASTTPHLFWLLEHASSLVSVSDRLRDEVRPFTQAPDLVWPIPAGITSLQRPLPADSNKPWQVLMGGAMYAGKTGFLENVFLPAWKQFQQTCPNTELVYVGKDLNGVPSSVRENIRALGVFPPDKVSSVLSVASVAVLPVLHEASTPWRYSVPARISDYLAAGLPVIAPHSEGTATHDFLLRVGAPAATLVEQRSDIIAALTRLHDSPTHWLAASHAATSFAREHLDMKKLRAQLYAFLDNSPKA